MKSVNKTVLFLMLTFSISYALAGLFAIMGGSFNNRIQFTILGVLYMYVPALCVWIVKKLIHKEPIKQDLRVSFKFNRWFLAAWFIMPILSLCAAGVSLLILPDAAYSPEMAGLIKRFELTMSPAEIEQMKKSLESMPIHPVWFSLLQGLIAGITVNALFAFGEELGWRGFLLDELKEMKFLNASLFIGAIWGVWHAPLILMGHNYPEHSQIGAAMMVVLCILLTPFFIYVTVKARSVIAAAIIHGALNATAGISIMVVDGGSDLTVGLTGLAGFIVLLAALGLLFIYDYYIAREKILINKLNINK